MSRIGYVTQFFVQINSNLDQSCIYHFSTRFGLAIGIGYFGIGQYWRSVSGLPQIYIYIYIDLLLYTFIHQNL